MDRTQQMEKRLEELEAQVRLLSAAATIPLDVDRAFRTRLGIGDVQKLTLNAKTAASETKTVNEAGMTSYGVAQPMDGFFRVITNGTARYIPYYL